MSSSAEPRSTARRRIAGERGRSRATTDVPATTATNADVPETGTLEPLETTGAAEAIRQDAADRQGAPEAVRADETARQDAADPRGGRRRWVVAVAALVASLAALAVVLGLTLQDAGAQARVDRAAASQARTSIEQLLSYNYKTIDGQSARVEGLLTGSFKGEFTSAMDKTITPMAVKNQTVVQAKVSDVGVMSSSPTTVKVLAFVNQARVGADQKQPVVDQNRVIATLTKVGDRWLVSKVDAF